MGAQQSSAVDSLTKNELDEINQVFKTLRAGRLHRYITKETFSEYFSGLDNETSDRLFDAFDTDKSGNISSKEFINGVALCARGTHTDKLCMIFRIFDEDNSGSIDRCEMLSLIRYALASAGKSKTMLSPLEKEQYEEELQKSCAHLVAEAFENDADEDGELTFKEFCKWAQTSFEAHHLMKKFQGMEIKILSSGGDAGISGPTAVTHSVHLGAESFDIKSIPPDFRRILADAGVKKSELKDPQTAQFLLSILLQSSSSHDGPPPLPPRTSTSDDATAPSLPPRESFPAPPSEPAPPPPPEAPTPPTAPSPPTAPEAPPSAPVAPTSLLQEIQQGRPLKSYHMDADENQKPSEDSDSGNSLLCQIRGPHKLKHVSIAPPEEPEQRNELVGLLSDAMKKYRPILEAKNQSSEEGMGADDDEWGEEDFM